MTRPVVFLNPVASLGGGERSLLDILAVLGNARPAWPRHLIVGEPGPLCEEAARTGATVEVVPMPPGLARFGEWGLAGLSATVWRTAVAALQLLPYLRRLRRAVTRARPRLIHSNGLKCHMLAGFVAPRHVPVVWHIHDFLTPRRMTSQILRRIARTPNLAVANSLATTADTQAALPGVHVETVYNGVDINRFTPGPEPGMNLDRLAGLPDSAPTTIHVGMIATYARWKGQQVFLDAAAELAAMSDLPPLRWYLIGGPVYQTTGSQWTVGELRDQIAARNLVGRVGLIPFQRDTPPIYRSLDIVVHASTRPEPFGLTIVEGMACGRAVIVSCAGGAAELTVDGVDAVGVPPNDARALAAAMRRLTLDGALRGQLGESARVSAVSRFSRDLIATRLLRCYDTLAG